MTPAAALREYGAMVLRSEFIARQVLENKVSRAFLHAIPGLEDYSMLGKVWYHTTEEQDGERKWDQVILDGPATGHLITMLQIPQAILDAVPEGPLTRPAQAAVALLRDPNAHGDVDRDAGRGSAVERSHRAVAQGHRDARRHARAAGGQRALSAALRHRGLGARAGRAARERRRRRAAAAGDLGAHRASGGASSTTSYLERLRRELPVPQAHLPYLFTVRVRPQGRSRIWRRASSRNWRRSA